MNWSSTRAMMKKSMYQKKILYDTYNLIRDLNVLLRIGRRLL